MSYAIIRHEKYKRVNLKGIYRHNERKNINYSNANIDKERTHLNYYIKQPQNSYEKEFERIKKDFDLKGQIKEVSNIVCECIITSDNNFFKEIGAEETKRYFKTAYDYEILRITGSDYAGFYQEELRYKLASYLGCDVHNMSMIFYAPLVLDWSGAKLSKSLYVKEGAYRDIPRSFINYSFLKEDYGYKGLDILYDIVLKWTNNPYMLFRHYSIYYFIEEFKKYE